MRLYTLTLIGLAGTLLFAVGCDTTVTQNDIDDQTEQIDEMKDELNELEANRSDRIDKAAEEARKDEKEDVDSEIQVTKEEITEEKEQLAAMKERYAVESKIEADIAGMNERIDKLEERVEDAKGDEKSRLEGQIKLLRAERDSLQKQFDELKAASGDTWAKLKVSTQEATTKLSESVDKAWDDWTDETTNDDDSAPDSNEKAGE